MYNDLSLDRPFFLGGCWLRVRYFPEFHDEPKVFSDSGPPRIPVLFYVTAVQCCLYFVALGRPYRLAVRTPPFHGGGTGSSPVRVASFVIGLFGGVRPRRVRGHDLISRA